MPSEVRREAAANREAYLQQSPQAGPLQVTHPQPGTPHTFPRHYGGVQGHPHLPEVGTVPGVGPAVHAVEELFPDEEGLNDDVVENTVAKNAVGGN